MVCGLRLQHGTCLCSVIGGKSKKDNATSLLLYSSRQWLRCIVHFYNNISLNKVNDWLSHSWLPWLNLKLDVNAVPFFAPQRKRTFQDFLWHGFSKYSKLNILSHYHVLRSVDPSHILFDKPRMAFFSNSGLQFQVSRISFTSRSHLSEFSNGLSTNDNIGSSNIILSPSFNDGYLRRQRNLLYINQSGGIKDSRDSCLEFYKQTSGMKKYLLFTQCKILWKHDQNISRNWEDPISSCRWLKFPTIQPCSGNRSRTTLWRRY